MECGEGDRMINPIEQQLQRYWDRIQRALQVLQRAQRHHPENSGEMEACSLGEWIPIDDVVKAIQILEGQQ